jgi:biopolymer transport protein ExbB
MHFSMVKIISDMGPFALSIAISLVLMGVVAITVFVERVWYFKQSYRKARVLAAHIKPLLSMRQYDRACAEVSKVKHCYFADLMENGLRTYMQACDGVEGHLHPVEITKREMVRCCEVLGLRVRRGMAALASVGSVAPFVGLLGTVVGIIAAFQGIAAEGSGGLGAVSGGIAEALVVTALGLLIAIPSVLIFNFLTSQAEAIEQALSHARGELEDHLEHHHTTFSAVSFSKKKSLGLAHDAA